MLELVIGNPVRTVLSALLLSAALAAPAVFAAAPVEDSRSSGSSGTRLSELFYQLQVMQQELATLRGLAEEQSHQIKRLQRDQKEQYIDLDGRIAALSGSNSTVAKGDDAARGSAPADGPGSAAAGAAGASKATAASAATGGTSTGGTSERDDYNAALKLLRERRYDESLRGFNRILSDYPGGKYSGNALYWLGELYLVKDQSEQARAQFMQVIDLYNDHPKVPDALYKLGVTYHRLGDKHRALEYLNRVRGQYPQHSAAKLAADYAREMQ